MSQFLNDTICAPGSAVGGGAIAIVRLSGEKSLDIIKPLFQSASKRSLDSFETHSLRYGSIKHPDGEIIDDVLLAYFKAPGSFTGEESVEIYCHGSNYIVQEILMLLISQGARMAEPGEFTRRAFLNGKMDLTQAEAVADLISSETSSSHKIALHQIKGGFSSELREMRDSMLKIVSLMELELDFSEEDVEFADRKELNGLLERLTAHISKLIDSFKLGNVIKNGVPVAIAGATNTGKSTLLNLLLGEERAIVSNIHGTTRDSIEDTVNIGGHLFRFIDTAGIRHTTETIEIIGIERTYTKIRQASIVLLMLDAGRHESFEDNIIALKEKIDPAEQKIVVLINKIDEIKHDLIDVYVSKIEQITSSHALTPLLILPISAKQNRGVDTLKERLASTQKEIKVGEGSTLVSNIRHFEALKNAQEPLLRVIDGIEQQLSTDLLTQDIREALYHIGSITGEINTEEILGNIFKNFCIGK